MAADILSTLAGWSTTESGNAPSGSTAMGTNLDDNLRMIQAVVRLLAASSTIASATTTDLSTVPETIVTVSGTTTITGLGIVSAGIYKFLVFSGALTLTHNGTSLILPGSANVATSAGDVAMMASLGSGNWRCLFYSKANGAPITSVASFGDGSVSAPGIAFSLDPNTGIRRSGTDTMKLVAGGADVETVNGTSVVLEPLITWKQQEAGGYYTQIGSGAGYSKIYVQNAGSGAISSLLELNATAASGGVANIFEIKNNGGLCYRVRDDGATFADGAYSGAGADFAEWFMPAHAGLVPGDVVSLEDDRVKRCEMGEVPIGVISDRPCVIGNSFMGDKGGVLVGLVGQLAVKNGEMVDRRWIRMAAAGADKSMYLVR